MGVGYQIRETTEISPQKLDDIDSAGNAAKLKPNRNWEQLFRESALVKYKPLVQKLRQSCQSTKFVYMTLTKSLIFSSKLCHSTFLIP